MRHTVTSVPATPNGRVGVRVGFCDTPEKAEVMAQQQRELGCADVQAGDIDAGDWQARRLAERGKAHGRP